jgi:hypothetical protein
MTAMTKFIKWDWLVSDDLEITQRWRHEFWFYLIDLEIDNRVDLRGIGRVDLLVPDDPSDKRLLGLRELRQLDVNKRFRKSLYVKDQTTVDEVIAFVYRTAKKYNITVLDVEVKDALDVEVQL